MGWLRRGKRQANEDQGSPDQPIPTEKTTVDLRVARSVTEELCAAIGNHDRMLIATSRLRNASGMPDPDDVREIMAAFQREGGRSLTKPWRWLVASAERANDLGEPDVAVMAYFWATNWIYDVQPTLGAQGAFQLGFDAAPDGTHEALVVQAQRAVADLPDDYVVTVSDGATITAGSVALIVAEQAKAGGNLSPHIALQRAMNATTEHQREEDENRL